MASTDARPLPKKNTAYRHYFAIRKNDGTLISTWAGQDSKLSKDGAAFADAASEAAEIGTSGVGYIDLTAAEMNYDCVILKTTVTNADALPYVVSLFPEENGDIRVDLAAILGTALGETSAGYLAAAFKKLFDVVTPALVASDVMRGTDSAALAASALSTIQWTNALATSLGTLAGHDPGGQLAAQSDVQGIIQAQRVRVLPPPLIERPDSGSTTYRVWIYAYDEQHKAEDLDSNPTVTAENNTAVDRSGNLGTVTKPAATTGIYYVDYTVASTHAIEGLVFKVAATEGGVTTGYAQPSIVVDTTAVDFTTADRTKLEAVYNKLPSVNYLLGGASADGSGYSTHDAAAVKTTLQAAGSHLAEIFEDTGTTLPAALADGTVQVGTVRDGAIGAAAVADIFSTTTIAEAYAADGAAGTVAQLLYLIQQAINEFAISGTTKTMKKLDGSTTAATCMLNSATAPTSVTRSG